MSKIIPVHVILYNAQDVNTIYGLNSNRIFEEITPHKDGTTILYRVDTSQDRRDTLLISDSPVEIYRGMSMPINPTSVTLSLVGSGNVTVSIEDVVFCYRDVNNFAQSYLLVLSNDVETLYHVDMSLLSLIEELNDSDAQAACNLDGTLYWSAAGSSFISQIPKTLGCTRGVDGTINVDAIAVPLFCGVNLPDGATITGAIVYGDGGSGDETWYLKRVKLSDASEDAIASAVMNTEDTTISNASVDNSTYAYYLYTSSMELNDTIYGARISYTL